MTGRNGTEKISLLGQLSSIATLIAIVTATVAITGKLEALNSRALQNCRAINASIVLTLESTRARARERGTEAELDRTIDRFDRLAAAC